MRTKKNKRKVKNQPDPAPTLQDPTAQARRLEWVFMVVLLGMGIYLAITYFGQKAVPNSDFPAFVQTGHDILHFQMPHSFKRVPVLGILQITVGRFMVNSPHPVLTGALLLNAILYTLSIVLFYKLARFFLPPVGSFCLSLIAAANPYALVMVVDPIAETAIVFFIMLTLYLIFIRSRWCYLAAMLASMTRYECFGLIGIALLFDLLSRQTKRQKLTALGAACAAAVPMAVWMIGTKITTTDPNDNYFRVFLNVENRNGFDLLKMLWTTTFSSLLQWPDYIHAVLIEQPATPQAVEAVREQGRQFTLVWNTVTVVLFMAGVIAASLKKQWRLAGILLFWVGYLSIHMSQSVLLDRYTLPMVWLTLLTAAFGVSSAVTFLNNHVPRGIMAALAVTGAVIALLWMAQLWPALPQTSRISPASAQVGYAGLLLMTIGLGVQQVICRGKGVIQTGCLFAVTALVLVSNQFTLSWRLGQGDLDIEFRRTAEWYLENTDGTEKLATTLPGVMNLFLPQGKKNAVHTGGIAGTNLAEFAQSCRQRKIRYVAWDSRLGFATKDVYYQMWGLKKIHPLGSGKDIGPFRFIRRIETNRQQRYINLYRLDNEDPPLH